MALKTYAYEYKLACGAADSNVAVEHALMLSGGAESGSKAELSATNWIVNKAIGGDYLVLRTGGVGGQGGWICETYSREKIHSAAELSVDSIDDANNTEVIEIVKNAELIFIAGGDQNKYEDNWKGTKLALTLNEHIKTKPIMGTSAGMVILAQSYYAPNDKAVIASEILDDPYHINTKDIFHRDFLLHPMMKNVIVDTHINRVERSEQRYGRLFGFLARSIMDRKSEAFLAVGLEEATFLAVDSDWKAKVFGGHAFFMQAVDFNPQIKPAEKKLFWDNDEKAVAAYIIKGNRYGAGRFDFKNWLNVDGGYWRALFTDDGYKGFNCKNGC